MWQSLKIAKKIWLSIIILILGYFISMFFGYLKGQQTEESLYYVSEALFPASQKSQAALTAFEKQIKLYNDAVLLGDSSLVEMAKDSYNDTVNNLTAIKNNKGTSSQQIVDIQKILQQLSGFISTAGGVYTAMSSDSIEITEGDDMSRKAAVLAEKTITIRGLLTVLTNDFSQSLKSNILTVRTDTKRLRFLNLVLFFIVFIISSVLIYFIIKRSISRPLGNTVSMIKDIAEGEGDLTKRLEVLSSDEVGDLSMWFNNFIDNLQGMIKKIMGYADLLGSSSKELTDLSGLMTDGANQMSEKSNGVATAANEMNTNMDSVAAAMEEASTNTEMVATAAEQMTATINEIAQNSEKAATISTEAVTQAQNASNRVEELGIAAQEVGKVTEAITEISEQTNLLALNATIEAARAGEAGKGFAVVANEIKELARQTAEATHDIKEKIAGIQSTTAATVSDIGQISKIIDDVNEIVSTIATAVEEQSVTTKEIANNVVQVSSGISDVNQNVAQSSSVADQIANDIDEVNHAAGEMSNSSSMLNMSAEKLAKLALELNDLVNKFKV